MGGAVAYGMHDNLQITFRGMFPSPAIESLIQSRTDRLARVGEPIQRCHVVVEQPHRHHHKGRSFSVHLVIKTPRGEIVVTREPDASERRQALQAVVRDAFDVATRQIEDRSARRRELAQSA